jgi:hypothetical protein
MAEVARPVTPPPQPPSGLDLTPEQVKRIELNRLRGAALALNLLHSSDNWMPDSEG